MNPSQAGGHNPYAAGPPGATYPPPPPPATTEGSTKLGTSLMVLATVLIGLMAGLFFAYDISVMPGLADADPRTYVTAMQNFNAEIDGNGLFGMAFILALVAAGASAVIEFRKGRRAVALFVGAAAVAYLVVLMITFTVNIPLNNELKDVGDAAKLTDFSIVDKFKSTWVSTNIVRTLLCTAALTALSRALVLYGRATARR
ncbi:DUF1772 domain-containing protein [Streptomyces sp. WAC06614]|uniref:anthrone oxygenase family protein n=1 Tax=Streptomyces sp. WAC06614 TaxID=2487416 RepID=UPI000F7901E6|nr:DUF1772 domain-containing protein [Streptomyces sp. WAC06614]RSS71769.1 DUF1772 domain-containing protein [Streptomyces sp. WAC06614]